MRTTTNYIRCAHSLLPPTPLKMHLASLGARSVLARCSLLLTLGVLIGLLPAVLLQAVSQSPFPHTPTHWLSQSLLAHQPSTPWTQALHPLSSLFKHFSGPSPLHLVPGI